VKPEGSPPTVILTACLVGQSLPEGTIGCRFWLPLTSPDVMADGDANLAIRAWQAGWLGVAPLRGQTSRR